MATYVKPSVTQLFFDYSKTVRSGVPEVRNTYLTYQIVSPTTKYRTANWKTARKQSRISGGLPPQYPYSTTFTKLISYRAGSCSYSGGWNSYIGSFWCSTSSRMPTTHVEQLTYRGEAKARLAVKINNKVRAQHMSVPEIVYEGRKTVKMITSAVSDLAQAALLVKQGRFQQAARKLGLLTDRRTHSRLDSINALRANRVKSKAYGAAHWSKAKSNRSFSDNWLEFRYGWTPLYESVYGSMKTFYDVSQAKPQLVRVEARELRKFPVRYYDETPGSGYMTPTSLHSMNTFWKRSTENRDTEVRAVVYFKVHNKSISAATQMGLTNPLLVAWEFLPLSFVADWFVNVSDCLAELDTWVGKEFYAGSYTTRDYTHMSSTLIHTGVVGGGASFSAPLLVAERTDVTREIMTTPPLVPLTFQLELNLKRVVDGVALLKQRFKSDQ